MNLLSRDYMRWGFPFWGRLFLLLALAVLFSGCAAKVKLNMLQPAQYHQASLTKNIAVLPFEGKEGREMSSEIEATLAGINIDNKQYFNIVDRASLDKVLSELKLSQSSLTDPNSAIEIGKIVSAQGIYTGMVNTMNWKDSPFREDRQECVQHEIKRDSRGNEYEGNCIRWRRYSVRCMKRDVNVAVTPKLVEVSTGKILYSKSLTAAASSSGCEDRKPPQGEAELFDIAKNNIKGQLRKDIAPYYVTVEVKLMDSTDGIEAKAAKENLDRGIDAASKGRIDMACELWGSARILAPSSPAILYNLGICAESRGDVDAALGLYKLADRAIGKPQEDITFSLNRATAAVSNKKKLEEQLKQ